MDVELPATKAAIGTLRQAVPEALLKKIKKKLPDIETVGMATDELDGVKPEDLVGLPVGDGTVVRPKAFEARSNPQGYNQYKKRIGAPDVPPVSTRSTGADMKVVAFSVINGKAVDIDPVDADDLLEELAKADVPVDLTLVNVQGVQSMFNESRATGLPRDQMPQIPQEKVNDFKQILRDKGVDIHLEEVDPADLKPTQSQLDGRTSGQIQSAIRRREVDFENNPLWVADDGHIMDGHHRWAGISGISTDLEGGIKIMVVRVGMPIGELLDVARQFNKEAGIEAHVFGQKEVNPNPAVSKRRASHETRALADTSTIFDQEFWQTETALALLAEYENIYLDATSKLDLGFDVQSAFAQDFIKARANQLAGNVTQTTYDAIKAQLSEGASLGESIPDIAKRIRGLFEQTYKNRATTVARTEVISAYNGSARDVATNYPEDVVAGLEWLATPGSRTRPTHAHASGQVIPRDGMFIVGGASMAYPGDPSGPAREVVNCRCTLLMLTPEDLAMRGGFSETRSNPEGYNQYKHMTEGFNSSGSIGAKAAKAAGLTGTKYRTREAARLGQRAAAEASAADVAARLSPEDAARVQAWTGTNSTNEAVVEAASRWSYGQHTREQAALNEAARDAFGLEGPAGAHDEHHSARVAYVKARYEQTQDDLQTLGVERVGVFRGIAANSAVPRGNDVQITHNPLSAWTTRVDVADYYAKLSANGDSKPARVFTSVPRSAIFGFGSGGFGQPGDGEVVILGVGGTVNVMDVK